MKSLEDQVLNQCVHFTGIYVNKTCNAGIAYDEVVDKSSKPYRFPCLKEVLFTGGSCEKATFPSEEEAKDEVDRMTKSASGSIKALMLVKEYFQKTGERKGKLKCPVCGGQLLFIVAETNNHVRISCSCGISVME